MIVQACLNGARQPGYHSRLPITIERLVEDAAEAVAAGAAEIHLHVRGPDGAESLAPKNLDATIAAIRAELPGTLIGVSTGAWVERDDDRRLAMIAAWEVLPDYASVNLSEAGAPAVIERLRRMGIGIEAGLASAADAERLVKLGLGPLSMRMLVEMISQPKLAEAMAAADATLAVLTRAGIAKPVLLHGFDATMWPFIEYAAVKGFSTRVGLEDGSLLPDETTAASNAALVASAVSIMKRRGA